MQHIKTSVLRIIISVVILTAEIFSFANDKPLQNENSKAEIRLFEDIKYLSSDELQGRSADTPGLKMAAEFIANRWQELGLKTDLFNGKPYQEFQLPGGFILPEQSVNKLNIVKPTGEILELALSQQFQPQ
ncbi:MAG TPA: hypothetical protein VM260_15425, partial [Pirellula sp.]|nr:hypothetical protein [Pirellula sp.]